MKITTKTQLALSHLRDGVIAHPTDTIYGLACLASNTKAIATLAALKQRDIKNGFIMIASDISYLMQYLDPNLSEVLLAKLSAPTKIAITYLVPKSKNVSTLITGEHELLAVRITSNPLVSFFCENTNSALISTSANRHGKKVATSLIELKKYFGNELLYALPPNKYNSEPSRIVNLVTGVRYR